VLNTPHAPTRVWARTAVVLLAFGAVIAASCAPRTAPPPVVTPAFPEFVFPAVPTGVGTPQAVALHQRAWRFLQAKDLRNAQREFSAALQRSRGFYPAEAGLGYVQLAARAFREALQHFDRGLAVEPAYAPALVGRGEALLGLNRAGEAAVSFEAALAADPALVRVRERLEVLALRQLQDDLAEARQATEQGRYDEARRAYLRAIERSPDSAFLYRDLARVELEEDRPEAALANLRQAVTLDPGDSRTWVQIGEVLEAQGELDGAADAYARALAIEPSAGLAARADAVRERATLARLPAEYGALAEAPILTRGGLAALLGVRFEALLQGAPERAAVVIDAREHWASPWILLVVRASVMNSYPNHAFQPTAPVRRGDLAEALSRVLERLATDRPRMPRPWQGARPAIVDLPPGHLGYPAAAVVVTAGLMSLTGDGRFQPSRAVSGAEAIDAVSRLEALALAWTRVGGPEERRP